MSDGTADSRRDCFASLDTVFPMGSGGLREVSPTCWDCIDRVECLRQAVSGGEQAEVIAEEVASRGDGQGLSGFMRRWSRLKSQNRRKGS